jgi:hypothetical protein
LGDFAIDKNVSATGVDRIAEGVCGAQEDAQGSPWLAPEVGRFRFEGQPGRGGWQERDPSRDAGRALPRKLRFQT